MEKVPRVKTKKGLTVEVAVNEDDPRLDEPILSEVLLKGTTLSLEKVRAGIQKEMRSMDSFGVYEAVAADTVHDHTKSEAITTIFHLRYKGE